MCVWGGVVHPPRELSVQSQDVLNRHKVKEAAEFTGLGIGGSPCGLYQVLQFAWMY